MVAGGTLGGIVGLVVGNAINNLTFRTIFHLGQVLVEVGVHVMQQGQVQHPMEKQLILLVQGWAPP